jgi:hypothetical protein
VAKEPEDADPSAVHQLCEQIADGIESRGLGQKVAYRLGILDFTVIVGEILCAHGPNSL